MILDLRDDPGGLVDEAVEVASAFLDGGPVVVLRAARRRHARRSTRRRAATPRPRSWCSSTAAPPARPRSSPAALQDRDRAVVVGSRTFGKGSVQEPSRLADGSAIELTVGQLRHPVGRDASTASASSPTSPSTPASRRVDAESRALEVLTGLVAAVGPADGADGCHASRAASWSRRTRRRATTTTSRTPTRPASC